MGTATPSDMRRRGLVLPLLLPTLKTLLVPFLAVFLAVLAGTPTGVSAARAEPFVVASIKPIHGLVAAVMAGVGEPGLLVTGAGSPHTQTMRPSQARMLSRARLIFWVGPSLEAFLPKALAALGQQARIVRLIDTKGLRLFPVRRAGAWGLGPPPPQGTPAQGKPTPAKQDRDMAGGGREGRGAIDPHIWLDPINAKSLVSAIAAALGATDPANARLYDENAARLRAHMDSLDTEIRNLLRPVHGVPYVVYHDAYQYFERRYGLRDVGTVTANPERKPGLRRVLALRHLIREAGLRCVFAEPEFAPALLGTIIEGTGARIAVLDPLGVDLAPGPDFYSRLMRRLARGFAGCLGGASGG